ncbi:MAG TPA: thiamine-phosphate kinase [Pyrinomonadaceae bacterium]|nr:thiamine-phosphate kinase [Pyrinomonadaceae bacterium]
MRSEFDFIYHIKKSYGLDRVGDDCAVLPKSDQADLLITADMLVEDVDFRLGWTTPEFLGHKALAVSLSDIAAMGGRPTFAMLSIGVPERLWNGEFLDTFYTGWHCLAREFGVELVGGDVSRVPDKLVIDSIVLGEAGRGRAIPRSGAKPGDKIFVSGRLGGAAGGLFLLESGNRHGQELNPVEQGLINRQLRPRPRLDISHAIAKVGASAMIDLSDGLSSDLAHICESSGVGARIFFDRLPIDDRLAPVFDSDDRRLHFALDGGEDFELLFTLDAEKILPAGSGDLTCIGEITANVEKMELIRDGQTSELTPKGFQHFG